MPKQILVIDDEHAVREAFRLALAGGSYEISAAASGEEGLAKAQAGCPDLIFLDLRMPGIDGVETLRRIQPLCPGVRIFIVTAFRRSFMEGLNKAVQDGFTFDLVDKPIDLDQINAIVRAVFGDPQVY